MNECCLHPGETDSPLTSFEFGRSIVFSLSSVSSTLMAPISMRLLVTAALLPLLAAGAPLESQLDLGGAAWRVHSSNGSVAANATVPGVVHTDLLAAGLVPEPFAGFNELALRWVALENWTYSRAFTAPAAALAAGASVFLEFDGLDTVANISLNGRPLGLSVNAFVRWQVRLPSDLLRGGDGANELAVAFTCAQCYGQTAAALFPVPLHEFRANRYSYGGRPFVRKSQTHFGWNWGPGFITQGIYRGARLRIVEPAAAAIDSVLVQQADAAPPPPAAAAAATAWPPLPLPPPSAIDVSLAVDVRCAPSSTPFALLVRGALPAPAAAAEASVACPAAHEATVVSAALRLHVPVGSGGLPLWFPNGHGAQALHNLTVTLCATDASRGCAVPWSAALGLRVAQLVQESLPYTAAVNSSLGPSRSFYFRVNGLPVYGKGANDIPSDQFEGRVTAALLRDYLLSAKAAHMTMLRVWGGGLFERDEFYELCDEFGILLFHDAMFSDQIYPWDAPFLATVAAETRYQARRLSRHASLVAWSGTNENLPSAITNLAPSQPYDQFRPGQWAPTGGSNIASSFIYTLGAQQLYFATVGATLQAADAERAYVPSSPSNGWLSEAMRIPDACIYQARVSAGLPVAAPICNPSNPARGDAHFYSFDPGVAFNASALLPPVKFCSENGVESWPSIGPLRTVTEAADRWVGSEQMAFRERAGNWGPAQLDWVRFHFGSAPIDAANSSAAADSAAFESFLVLSQLANGLGQSGVAQQFRLNKATVESGATMGHLLWQLQDNWPGQSFGLLNYGGEWKQQMHFIRRSFAPLLVTATSDASGAAAVHLVSDVPRALRACSVRAALWDASSTAAAPVQSWSATVPSVAAGGVALQALQLQAPPLAGSVGFLRLSVSCEEGGEEGGAAAPAAEVEHFFPGTNFSHARAQLRDPALRAAGWATAGADCALTLSAAAPALFVVPSTGLAGRWSDSAFALVPGEQRALLFTPAGGAACDPSRLRTDTKFTSLHSLLQE